MSFNDVPREDRPREKLLARGAGALSDTELLAIVLRTGTAGRSVMTMAAELLQARPERRGDRPRGAGTAALHESRAAPATGFGGLAGLLAAQSRDLTGIKGLGPAKRAELLAIMELARRALAQQLAQGDVLNSGEAVCQYLQARLAHLRHEVFAAVFLDSRLRLIACEELFRGTLNQACVYPREVALRALQLHAHAVILAHNHPSGQLEPSQADIAITRHMRDALALLEIRLLDHVIVAQGASVSLMQKGLV